MMARVAPTMLRIFVLCGVVALPTAGCSSFDVLNAMVPSRASLRTSNVPYGAHPRQNLDVYRPRVNAKSAEPPAAGVVVFFYGGYWNSGSKADYRFVAEALTSQGFVAVLPDYRLYPDVTFPAFVEDGALAVRWAHDHAARIGGDPQRIYLMGHSAGAHIAALLTLDEHYLADVGLSTTAICATAALSGPYDFVPGPETRPIFNMSRDDETPPRGINPIHFADDGEAPPMLLIHGQRDDIVEPANAFHLAQRIRGAGGMVRTITYEKRGHVGVALALACPFRWLAPVLRDVTNFFNEQHVTSAAASRAPARPHPAARTGGTSP